MAALVDIQRLRMFWTKRKPILLALLDGQPFAQVSAADVPIELTPTIFWNSRDPRLVLTDSTGYEHVYDFGSVADASKCAALSLRVEREYVVQIDCILGNPDVASAEAFRAGTALGLRLQPFFLPEAKVDPASLIGRGLLHRGLHFPGIVTPRNVSLLCVCDSCKKTFRVQSFHAGFSQSLYFYCTSGHHTLVVESQAEDAPALLAQPDPASLSVFEARLPACTACGGSFKYWNSFRCPHCAGPYIDFEKHPEERAREYYGNYIFGQHVQRWTDPN